MSTKVITAAKIASRPVVELADMDNKDFVAALEEHVCCCSGFDVDCDLETFYEMMEELRKRMGLPAGNTVI